MDPDQCHTWSHARGQNIRDMMYFMMMPLDDSDAILSINFLIRAQAWRFVSCFLWQKQHACKKGLKTLFAPYNCETSYRKGRRPSESEMRGLSDPYTSARNASLPMLIKSTWRSIRVWAQIFRWKMELERHAGRRTDREVAAQLRMK